jgi:hypothetical protein
LQELRLPVLELVAPHHHQIGPRVGGDAVILSLVDIGVPAEQPVQAYRDQEDPRVIQA